MRWRKLLSLQVPARYLLLVCVAAYLLLHHGVRSGYLAAMTGEDSWVVTPPEGEAAIAGRPRAVLVTLVTRSEVREIASKYWQWCGFADAERIAADASVIPAPADIYPSGRRRYTCLKRNPMGIVVVTWCDSECQWKSKHFSLSTVSELGTNDAAPSLSD